jgi:hypothetical protein
MYSSVCYSEPSGDVRGELFVLTKLADELSVQFNWIVGEWQPSIAAKAKVQGDRIEFEMKRGDGGIARFAGSISPNEIGGSFIGWSNLNGQWENRWVRIRELGRWPNCTQAPPRKEPR